MALLLSSTRTGKQYDSLIQTRHKIGQNYLALLAKLENNKNYNVKQIIYDNGINQIFNPNIKLSHFENYEYLLPVLHELF